MLVRRKGGKKERAKIITEDNHVMIIRDVMSLTLSLHDMNALLELSPTAAYAAIKRLQSHYHNPLLGKKL